eukprot:823003-Rhodomonas_salina.2
MGVEPAVSQRRVQGWVALTSCVAVRAARCAGVRCGGLKCADVRCGGVRCGASGVGLRAHAASSALPS